MMRQNKYKFLSARRFYIPKPGKQALRPLGIHNSDDNVVQEAIRIILETIYEPRFLDVSHGSRPGKSRHTALHQVERQFDGMKWLIEDDFKSAYDSVDHGKLLNLLRKSINDERFILLIKRALDAEYIERPHKTITSLIGIPQGSIISPILFNIY
jgi:retron-type reverse transcriptase